MEKHTSVRRQYFEFIIDFFFDANNFLFAYLTEKYTRGVSAVESILTLDRLRQSVAIKELEQSHGQSLSMRKTVSVPNFSQVWRLLRVYTTLIWFCFFILKRYQASGFHFLITNPFVLCVYCVITRTKC